MCPVIQTFARIFTIVAEISYEPTCLCGCSRYTKSVHLYINRVYPIRVYETRVNSRNDFEVGYMG